MSHAKKKIVSYRLFVQSSLLGITFIWAEYPELILSFVQVLFGVSSCLVRHNE
jgi:hypothetical protein